MRLIHAMRKGYLAISVALLALVTALPIIQVVMRNLFDTPLMRSEEFTKYFLICLAFMAAPVAVSGAGMIAMDELRRALPGLARRTLSVLILAGSALIFAVATFSAVLTSVKNAHVSTTLGVPFWVFILPGTIGFLLVTFEYLVRLVEYWRDGESSYTADEIADEIDVDPTSSAPPSAL
ncbi:TRAP transporter small permease [Roseitalea porphyridii]|uniref:TRAP transporter small permease protein n=1 Tax=Roseitalea porphyridii TaxID=1852022 RepID=A0A4P6V386_9HYPH|nr:TRAP transporter small permease subunit [Roseitalea porphyridii]QBK31967.1 TRAP transporter small permease [Roseitalea porphyridii]